MSDRMHHLREVLRQSSLRRLLIAFAVFSIAENGTWIAVTVFAYDRGGVGEAGVVAIVQLAPAVVVAPLAAYAGDRFRKDVVLAVGYFAQATAMIATATAMWADASAVVIYGAATAAATAVTFTRPAMGALLPAATFTPGDLTAANVLAGVIEHVGVFLGPAVAGLMMLGGTPARVFAVMGAATLGSALLVSRLKVDPDIVAPVAEIGAGDVAGEALAGFRTLARERNVRLLVVVMTINTVIVGANDVLFVVAADAMTTGDAGGRAGLFGAAFGIGALLAATGAVVFVGRPRLATVLAASIAASAAALALIGVADQVVVVLLLFAVCGSGESIGKITGATLVQRVAPTAALSRIFGIVEGLGMAALAGGAAGVSLLIDRLGLRDGAIVLGAVLIGLVALNLPALRALDRSARRPDPALIELVHGQPMFELLPAPALERVLAGLRPVDLDAGEVATRQGDAGDRFFMVERGRLTVAVDGAQVRTLGPGDGFGEIALLRDVPRTATVTATEPARLQALPREDFLLALGRPQSLRTAHARSEELLADDERRRRGDLV